MAGQSFVCHGGSNEIGGDLPAGYEPSGAVWHLRLNVLFIVGDGGQVSQLDADGLNVTTWEVGGDLEGICVAAPPKRPPLPRRRTPFGTTLWSAPGHEFPR